MFSHFTFTSLKNRLPYFLIVGWKTDTLPAPLAEAALSRPQLVSEWWPPEAGPLLLTAGEPHTAKAAFLLAAGHTPVQESAAEKDPENLGFGNQHGQ